MRFTGDYTAKTDAKGRVFLPAALRKVLEAEGISQLVLRNDLFQHCLVLYPQTEWDARIDDLTSRLNPWNGQHQSVLRRFMLGAEPVELDSNGRILLSKSKLEFAGITSEVRFLAVDKVIEVWSKEALDAIQEQSADLGTDLEALISI